MGRMMQLARPAVRSTGAASPFASLRDVTLVPAPVAQHMGGGALPVGALTYSLRDNAAGATDPAELGAARHRGGTGLVSGVVTVHRDAMVPAALVVAKWGRLLRSDYGSGAGDPVRFTVELPPIFYESLMLDLAAVAGGSGRFGFVPQVEPAVFSLDVGTVNATVHGAGGGGAAAWGAASGEAMLVPSLPGRTTAVRLAAGGAGAVVGRPPPPRESASRAHRREVQSLQRLELRAVVAEGTSRAEEYLRGVARMGDDKELARLLREGYAVSYTPHPWYARVDVEGASRERERRASASARAGLLTAGGGVMRGISRTGLRTAESGGTRGASRAGLLTAGTSEGGTRGASRAGLLTAGTFEGALPLEDTAFRPGTTYVSLRRSGDTAGGPAESPGGGGVPTQALYVMPDLNASDPQGLTAVALAAKHGWLECVSALLRAGADHRRRSLSGHSAFDLARIESELASLALAAGQPAAAARKRRAALTVALLDDRSLLECARTGDLRRLRHLVEREGHSVASTNAYGMTALHFAVEQRSPEMVAFLCTRGADPAARNNVGQTPASLAMGAVGEAGGVQAALLEALAEGPLQEARRAHARDNSAETLEARRHANEELARHLREYTRGTTAAKAVQRMMPPGVEPDFGAGRGGGAGGGGRY